MRLYLLPVSTRRTLLYAQRLHATSTGTGTSPPAQQSYVDRATSTAAKKWAEWEKKESGWQKKVVDLGNHAFRRIPYEEWGLKSVPPLSARQRALQQQQQQPVRDEDRIELVFPGAAIEEHKAEEVVRTLAMERQALHRKRLIWCFVGMPISAPFALVPIIPNLPFFYLVYRAWSHWRALSGGKHIQWLLERKMLVPTRSPILDKLYGPRIEETANKEQMVLTQDQVRTFSETLDIPALEIELERAIWQVEQKLQRPDSSTAQGKDGGARVSSSERSDEKGEEEEKKRNQ